MSSSRYAFLVLILLSAAPSYSGNDSLLVKALLSHISDQQVRQDPYFMKGIFPSYISHHTSSDKARKDNVIFCTLEVVNALKNLKGYLPAQEAKTIDTILCRSAGVYPAFKNKKGRNTYNFYRTDSAFRFHYIGPLNLFRHKLALADDLDDTSLALLAMDAGDSTVVQVHRMMQNYCNVKGNRSKSRVFFPYNYPAYSVWFGKKEPVCIDLCVLTNILLMVETYNLQLTRADSASVDLIADAVNGNKHITGPFLVSPYYPETSLILYHISRLMSVKKIPGLEGLKGRMISDARTAFENSGNILEKLMLATAMIRWGVPPPDLNLPSAAEVSTLIEENRFPLFAGDLYAHLGLSLRKHSFFRSRGLYYWRCPVLNDAVLLEYLVLKDR